MIRADADGGFAARITAKAKAIAEARAERRRVRQPWRRARLLWPLFVKG